MQQSNIEFLSNQIKEAVKRTSTTDISTTPKFTIEFDEDEKQEPKTNFDEIMYHWALPKKLNQELELSKVCESLVTGMNEMPLWIKLSQEENSNLYRLKISKRFRKKNILKEWHKENEFMPVIIEKR